MICPVCAGAGNLVTFKRGLEYWPCVCGGAGVLYQHQPARIIVGKPAKRHAH